LFVPDGYDVTFGEMGFHAFPGQKAGAALNHFQNRHGDRLAVVIHKYDNDRRVKIQSPGAPGQTLTLALASGRFYFRGMKPISFFWPARTCCCSPLSLRTAPPGAAEREAAEENYKLLSSAVNGLTTGQVDLQRRLGALADEIRALRAQDNKIDTSRFVTRDELNRLVESVKEIDRKREADKKLILDEFEELKKDLRKMLSAPASAPPPPRQRKTGVRRFRQGFGKTH